MGSPGWETVQGVQLLRAAEDDDTTSRRIATEKGCKVRFRLADVFLPDANELSAAIRNRNELEGVVIGFSDSGERSNAFALIELAQQESVVVPVEKLQPCGGPTYAN
jgi:hypothetical protein